MKSIVFALLFSLTSGHKTLDTLFHESDVNVLSAADYDTNVVDQNSKYVGKGP